MGELKCARCGAEWGMFKRDADGHHHCADCWVARALEAEARVEKLERLRTAVADYIYGCDCLQCFQHSRIAVSGEEGTQTYRKCLFECPMNRMRSMLAELDAGGERKEARSSYRKCSC